MRSVWIFRDKTGLGGNPVALGNESKRRWLAQRSKRIPKTLETQLDQKVLVTGSELDLSAGSDHYVGFRVDAHVDLEREGVHR
jgi:hypothetical protein